MAPKDDSAALNPVNAVLPENFQDIKPGDQLWVALSVVAQN